MGELSIGELTIELLGLFAGVVPVERSSAGVIVLLRLWITTPFEGINVRPFLPSPFIFILMPFQLDETRIRTIHFRRREIKAVQKTRASYVTFDNLIRLQNTTILHDPDHRALIIDPMLTITTPEGKWVAVLPFRLGPTHSQPRREVQAAVQRPGRDETATISNSINHVRRDSAWPRNTTSEPPVPIGWFEKTGRRAAERPSNNEQTVRVLADYEVRLLRVRLSPLLILLFSVAPITTANMNAEMTAIVKTVIDIVRNAHLPTAPNARALLLPASEYGCPIFTIFPIRQFLQPRARLRSIYIGIASAQAYVVLSQRSLSAAEASRLGRT